MLAVFFSNDIHLHYSLQILKTLYSWQLAMITKKTYGNIHNTDIILVALMSGT